MLDILAAPFNGLNWFTDQIFSALNSLFDRFGVPIVFVAALSEATLGLGVIVPGVLLMFLAGAYTAEQGGSLAVVFGVAVIGTILGDTFSYGVGRWGSRWLAGTRFGPTLRFGEALMRGRARWLIPFYHLHSVTRAVGPFGSGALRLPARVWMPLDYMGAVIANGVWVGAGAIFGRALLTEDGTLESHPAIRIGLGAVAMVWALLSYRALQARAREMRAGQASDGDAVPVGAGGEE